MIYWLNKFFIDMLHDSDDEMSDTMCYYDFDQDGVPTVLQEYYMPKYKITFTYGDKSGSEMMINYDIFAETVSDFDKITELMIVILSYTDRTLANGNPPSKQIISRFPSNLKKLVLLSDNRNETYDISNLPDSLEVFDCSDSSLVELPKLPSNLKQLMCYQNNIGELEGLPNSLEKIVCFENDILSIGILPKNLKHLDCAYNENLTTLPELPDSLEYLNCAKTGITWLPKLPPNLQELDCGFNDINPRTCHHINGAMVGTFPKSLKKLICNNCSFTQLLLPDNLEYLNCSNSLQKDAMKLFIQMNQNSKNLDLDRAMKHMSKIQLYGDFYNTISYIGYPNSLIHIDCSGNEITSFYGLPKNLKYFDCSHNEIDKYDSSTDLPEGLETLNIKGNNIPFKGKLGKLPKSLKVFEC